MLHTHSHCFPAEGALDRGSPTCHCGSNYPAGSLAVHHLLQLSALLTTSVSTHILSVHTDTRGGGLQNHTFRQYSHTHNRQYKPGRVFHPQFTLHRLMARTNLNDVLVHTSCSSEDKHISLYGHSCKCAHVFCYIHYHR